MSCMCPNSKNDFVKWKECYPTLTVNSPAFKWDIIFKNRKFANINNVIRKLTVTFNIVDNEFTKSVKDDNVKSKK